MKVRLKLKVLPRIILVLIHVLSFIMTIQFWKTEKLLSILFLAIFLLTCLIYKYLRYNNYL